MKAQITFSINQSIQKVENTPASTTVTTRYDHFSMHHSLKILHHAKLSYILR